jgi:hypothetical protein
MTLVPDDDAKYRLTAFLDQLARDYYEGAGDNAPDVRLTDETPHADANGRYVAVNPDVSGSYGRTVTDADALKIVADTLAHEVEHINRSDLKGKKAAAERNPDMPRLAADIANIVEDCRIDWTRAQRHPGQRATHAAKVDLLMDNHHRRPRVDNMDDGPARYLETALQVAFAGYAKGLENCTDEFQRFAAEVDSAVSAAERAETPADRADVTDEIAEIFRRHLPDGTTGRDADEAVDEVDHSHTDEEPPEGNPIDPADADRDTELEPAPDADGETPDETAGELDDLDDLDADDFDKMPEPDEIDETDETPDIGGDDERGKTPEGADGTGDDDTDAARGDGDADDIGPNDAGETPETDTEIDGDGDETDATGDPDGDAEAASETADNETDAEGAAVDDGGDGAADDGTGPLCPDCGHTVEVLGGADE